MNNQKYLPKRLKGIQEGDIVVFRSMEELQEEFGESMNGIRCGWAKKMQKLCGEEFIVTSDTIKKINRDDYRLFIKEVDDLYYDVSIDMLKFKEKEPLQEQINNQEEIIHTVQPTILNKDKEQHIIDKMISLVDMSRVNKLFAIAGSSENRKKMPKKEIVMDYLNRWANAKYEYFLLFNENLQIEKEVEFELDEMEMNAMVETLCYQFPKYALLLENMTSSEFVNNSLDHDHGLKKYIPKHFQHGMKVSKFLSILLEDEKFDIEISKILQNRKIKGKIVISIDPYDYLTMSLNAHQWISCHNLEDGCYATGAFSYMCDEATLIAYRDNNKTYSYNYFGFKYEGNSKSWRQCIYFDKSSCSMIFGRQYPNESTDISKGIRELLEEVVSKYVDNVNKWIVKTDDHDGKYKDLSDFHYSDINNDFPYKFARFKNLEDPDKIKFEVGSKVKCVYCGTILHSSRERVSCC